MSLIEKALEKKQANKGESQEKKPMAADAAKVASEQEGLSSTASEEGEQEEIVQRSEKAQITLNYEYLKSHGMIMPDESRSHIKEEFRFIKRKLLNNAFGSQSKLLDEPNLIMVTSANPNEGKSFTATNLALSIALEQDKTVLLVDADVLRPSVCHSLGIKEPESGLIDYLLGKKKALSEVIQHTDIPRLKLLSSGMRHHLTSELISSEKMALLAKELSGRYPDRVIIFDAPPLLGVNESQNLAHLVGQILLVVEEDKTPHRDVTNAMALLDPDKAIGCILNKASRKRNQYYGYGYGEYYD